MDLTITIGLAAVAVTFLILFYRDRKWKVGLFKRMGIPGPEPHWLYGNLLDFSKTDKLARDVVIDWTKKYGKLYGYYEGPRPILVTSDPEFVKEVFIKHFSNFYGRRLLAFQAPSEMKTGSIVIAGGSRWKRLRAIINPTFSALKLKSMLPMMKEKVKLLEENLLEASKNMKESVNVRPCFERLTLSVIGDAAFGMNVDPQHNPDDPYLKHCRSMFANLNPNMKPLPLKAAEIFPELRGLVWLLLQFFIKRSPFRASQEWIYSHMTKVVEERRAKQIRRPDLLQLMLDSEANESINDDDFIMTTDYEEKLSPEKSDTTNNKTRGKLVKRLTEQEIKSQSFIFLIAGFETTATTLGYATYLLAMNPDKQTKLIDEIDATHPPGTEVTYDSIKNMSYMNMVVCETLRLYPVAARAVNRQCFSPCKINDLDIPEGMAVHVDVWSIHYDKKLWGEDADKFVPERFSPEEAAERHPMAWLPFGAGPKNCVGQRFGQMEIKTALTHILQKYTFDKCDETEENLTLCDRIVIVPLHGITIKLVPRG
ncbi:hypothetical protein LSH36_59g01037 [Paralvinella palmiformis]|uniref:Thromboxane-A synthase n=1 Tax=Paralvinella palmiformis TaxID=53620 RepID=A0AAD9K5X1_9ANNE|nr:hypothetical protein LSH36_59g01037 [Paralvinella palmiformis]